MRRIKQLCVLFTGFFIIFFPTQAVLGSSGNVSRKSIPPDSDSEYEESLFQVVEEKDVETAENMKTIQPNKEDGKDPDQSLLDFKRRLLEEQQERIQRTIAEDSQR